MKTISKLIAVVIVVLSTTLVCKSQSYDPEYQYHYFWKPDSIMTFEECQNLIQNCNKKNNWDDYIQQYSLGLGTDFSFQTGDNNALEQVNHHLEQTYSIYEMLNFNSGTIKKSIKVIKKTIIENLDNGQYRVLIWVNLKFL